MAADRAELATWSGTQTASSLEAGSLAGVGRRGDQRPVLISDGPGSDRLHDGPRANTLDGAADSTALAALLRPTTS